MLGRGPWTTHAAHSAPLAPLPLLALPSHPARGFYEAPVRDHRCCLRRVRRTLFASGVDPHQAAGALVVEQLDVGVDHDLDELRSPHLWFPAEVLLRLGEVADQSVHLGGALVALVMLNVLLPLEADVLER